VRDLLAAEGIARLHVFPSSGPNFNQGTFALGPIWFYVLAVPSLLGLSLSSSALYVGALASLKLPLAFRSGVLLGGRRLGWCLAAAACWPGVQAFQWLWWSTPNVLETCLWAGFVSAIHALGDAPGRWRWWIATAALFGLAIHAHPLAVLYAPLLGAAWIRWCLGLSPLERRRGIAPSLLVGLAAFAVWFLPGRVVFLPGGSAGSPSGLELLRVAWERAPRVGSMLANLLWSVPIAAWETWGSVDSSATWIPRIAVVGWHAATLLGLWLGWRRFLSSRRDEPSSRIFRLIAGSAATAVVGLFLATVLRPWVAFYTVYAVVPALCVVQGGAIWMLGARGGRWWSAAASLALSFSLGGLVWLSVGAMRTNAAGMAILPLAVRGDLASTATAEGPAMIRVRQSARASTAISQWLCENGVDVVHGTLALAAANEHGLLRERYCPRGRDPILLGKNLDRHAVGLPSRWFELARKSPALIVDGIGVGWAKKVVHPRTGSAVSTVFQYSERVRDRLTEPVDLVLHFRTPDDSVVALTTLKPWRGHTEVLSITRNGEPIEPAARSSLGVLWIGASPPPGASEAGPSTPRKRAEWTMTIRTDVPRWVDVVTF